MDRQTHHPASPTCNAETVCFVLPTHRPTNKKFCCSCFVADIASGIDSRRVLRLVPYVRRVSPVQNTHMLQQYLQVLQNHNMP